MLGIIKIRGRGDGLGELAVEMGGDASEHLSLVTVTIGVEKTLVTLADLEKMVAMLRASRGNSSRYSPLRIGAFSGGDDK